MKLEFKLIERNKGRSITEKWTLLSNRLIIRDSTLSIGTFIQFAIVEATPFPRLFYRIANETDPQTWTIKMNSGQKCVQITLQNMVRQRWKIDARKTIYLRPDKTIEGWTELLIDLKP